MMSYSIGYLLCRHTGKIISVGGEGYGSTSTDGGDGYGSTSMTPSPRAFPKTARKRTSDMSGRCSRFFCSVHVANYYTS